MLPELILFTGLQGSGKSSFYQKKFADTHLRINLDMLRTRHREKLLIQACLAAKQSLVIDNTNVTRDERAAYFAMLAASPFPFRCSSYFFPPDFKACLERNAQRSRQVPEIGIRAALKRLQAPSFDEGFEQIFEVTLCDGDFLIKRWEKL
ncbi:MAG: hypothetical protein RL095_1372 [Verrucomicrobiota bacterium]